MSSSTSSSDVTWWVIPKAVGVLAALAVATELLLRVVSPIYIRSPDLEPIQTFRHGYETLVPGSVVDSSVVGRPVSVTVNAQGMREIPYPDDFDGCLVLGVGNSFVANWAIPPDEFWARHLERELNGNARTKGCAVRSAGVQGWTMVDLHALAMHRFEEWRPDLVILFFNHQTMWTDRPLLQPSQLSGPETVPPVSSWTPTQTANVLFNRLERESATLGNLKVWMPHVGMMLGLYQNVVHTPFHADQLEALTGPTHAAFDAFADEVAASGGKLIVAYLPTSYEIDPSQYHIILSSIGGNEAGIDLDEPTKQARSWADARHVPFVDLTPVLADRREGRTYDLIDQHWNQHGNEVAGKALADPVRMALDGVASREPVP